MNGGQWDRAAEVPVARDNTVSASETCSEAARLHLRLHLADGVGAITFGRLMERFGSAEAILGASHMTLREVEGVGEKTAEAIRAVAKDETWKEEVRLAEEQGVRILCREDADYPRPLTFIPDPPICLYVMGEVTREDALSIGIVGSRQASLYGIEQAQRFSELLCRAGLTVISGMARGIDQAAHMAAIRAGGRTIAVLGCGLCHCYPPESIELRDKIRAGGAVVSELPMGTRPTTQTFPRRNRIIAGLSLGTLVIEAGLRSGALITARLASEYNREVFALPGRVDTQQAEGTNDLIRQGGAKLVTGLADILDELGEAGEILARGQAEQEKPTGPNGPDMTAGAGGREAQEAASSGSGGGPMPAAQKAVYDIVGGEPVHLEQIAVQCDLPIGQVSAALTLLQLRGLVKQLPGNLFSRRKESR